MSKNRHKNRNNRPGGRAMPSEADQYASAANFLQSLSGFDGANQSSRRGWIYWPTLDTKKELNTYSRTELLKKSRWLRANIGLASRICRGLSEKIGYLMPLSDSGNEDWDEVADEHWRERACEASLVDASGQFDIRAVQIELNTAAFGDGDILPLLIKGPDGLQFALYEANQIKSPADSYGDKSWIDGVRINKFGRHLDYGIAEENDVRVFDARDALYYSHPDAPGRVRAPTILSHAINHMLDISEILADVKLTIKTAAQMGLYIENEKANSGGYSGPQALGAGLRNEQATAGATPTPTPEDPKRGYKVEDFFRPNGGVLNMPAGAKIGTIQDTRPHPNQINLINHLIRDIAWGVGVPPEILWDIHELGGANTRLVNADLDRWIAAKQIRQIAWMKRFRAIWIANEIEAGRLAEPPAGAKFWKASWLPQASITADKARIGTLDIELVKNRMRSLAAYYAEQGLDWQVELRQIAREEKMLRDLGLKFEDLAPEKKKAA
jgi:capsid protein